VCPHHAQKNALKPWQQKHWVIPPQANVPIQVVQEQPGHKQIEMTLNIYAHALPSMQQDAAAKLAALLHT
jgi:integrase